MSTEKKTKQKSTPYPPEDRFKMQAFLQKYGRAYTNAQFQELQASLTLKKRPGNLGAALRYMHDQLNTTTFRPESTTAMGSLSVIPAGKSLEIPFRDFEVNLAEKKVILHF